MQSDGKVCACDTSPSASENDKCNINVVDNYFETVKKILIFGYNSNKANVFFFFHETPERKLKLLEYFPLPFG
jgi:hypothetical protein